MFANENKEIVPHRWIEYIEPVLEMYNQEYLKEIDANQNIVLVSVD